MLNSRLTSKLHTPSSSPSLRNPLPSVLPMLIVVDWVKNLPEDSIAEQFQNLRSGKDLLNKVQNELTTKGILITVQIKNSFIKKEIIKNVKATRSGK